MKWSYKTYYAIIAVYLSMMTLWTLIDITTHYTSSWYSKASYYSSSLLHMLIDVTVIFTLKRFGENVWRLIPVYVLIIEEIVATVGNTYIGTGNAKALAQFEAAIMLISIALCFYLFISMLFTKNRAISLLLKLYGFILVSTMFLIAVVAVLYSYFPKSEIGFRVAYYVLFIAHTIPLLLLYIKLQNKTFSFAQGDNVLAIRAFDNVPIYTHGTITTKYPDKGFYEVEFFDVNGNLLNVLTVSNKDIEHIAENDLLQRINAFGK